MRTTLDLDDAVLSAAKALAKDRGVSIGRAVSELALVGLRPPVPSPHSGEPAGFPTFELDPDAPPITLDLVNDHRDE